MTPFATCILLFTGIFSSCVLNSQPPVSLEPGDKAPVFTATDDNDQLWDISNYLGKKNIVLFFYPAAMTGGCTNQACAYRDNIDELTKLDAVVVGISGDEVNNLKLFKEAHDLNFPLLSDPTGEIAGKFGVPVSAGGSIQREVNDRKYTLTRGVTSKRWTFIVDKEGFIRYVNQSVNAANDSKNVLGFLKLKEE